jgi:hypothetical protein
LGWKRERERGEIWLDIPLATKRKEGRGGREEKESSWAGSIASTLLGILRLVSE